MLTKTIGLIQKKLNILFIALKKSSPSSESSLVEVLSGYFSVDFWKKVHFFSLNHLLSSLRRAGSNQIELKTTAK